MTNNIGMALMKKSKYNEGSKNVWQKFFVFACE